jgi:hypothetical protein
MSPGESFGGDPQIVRIGTSRGGKPARTSPRARWVLAIAAVAALAVAIVLLLGAAGSPSFSARAQSICLKSRQEAKSVPAEPTSLAQGMQIMQRVLLIYRGEVAQLAALHPPPPYAGAFRRGVDDDSTLTSMLGSMLARPDFVELALSLPGHPELVPAWLTSWLQRTRALELDARAQFAKVPGIAACQASLS